MDDEALENASTFPPPPPHHIKFTSHNLRLLSLLQQHDATSTSSPQLTSSADYKGKQREVLLEEEDVPDWDLRQELLPPRVDWIVEDGGYEAFGDYFPIPAKVPGVEDMGVTRLIPPSPTNLKAYLQTLLQSHLQTTLLLLRALAHPPPPPPPEFTSQEQFDAYNAAHGATVAQPYVARLAEIDVNMMVAVNGLRGEQGEMTVEGMMRAQVERRREETRGVRKQCEEVSKILQGLRSSAAKPSFSLPVDTKPSKDQSSILGRAREHRAREEQLMSMIDEI